MKNIYANNSNKSHTARSLCNKGHTRFCLKPLPALMAEFSLIASLTLPFIALPVAALPQAGQVVAGEASLTESSQQLQINQQSDRAVIEYDSFSIGVNERVDIYQPNENSVLLNKVVGTQFSQIDGQFNANGQVILVNQNGIVFSAGSQINTGGLIASTLSLDNHDFMAKRLAFTGDDTQAGAIQQGGKISISAGGNLALIAPVIVNTGDIHVAQGEADLISANALLYQTDDSPIALLIEDSASIGAIHNSGVIEAARVQVEAAVENSLYTTLVDNSGLIRATGLNNQGGTIEITAANGDVMQTGTLDVAASASHSAGSVTINAGRIGQQGEILAQGFSTAGVDADPAIARANEGENEGGNGGKVTLIAEHTLVLDNHSKINADAGLNGTGGDIYTYSPNTNLFRQGAQLSARGGQLSGDGGFIEVSGLHTVEFNGIADASSPAGAAGLVYIDPIDITIASAGVDNTFDDANPVFNWNPNGAVNTATLDPATIKATLALGTDIHIDSNLATGGTGNITFNDSLDYDGALSGGTLTFTAAGSITFSAGTGIYDSNTGTNEQLNLVMTAGGNLLMNSNSFIRMGAGTVSLVSGGSATIAEISSTNAANNAIQITAGNNILDDGDQTTTISARNGGTSGLVLVSANGIGATNALDTDVDFLSLTNSAATLVDINQTGDLSIANFITSGDLQITTTGNLSLDSALALGASSNNITLNAGNNLTINANMADSSGPVDNTSNINLIATNNLAIADGVTVNAGSGTLSLNANSAAITGLVTNNAALNAINISAATLTNAGDTLTDITNTSGGATLNGTSLDTLAIDVAKLDLTTTGNATLHQQNASALDIQNISVGGNFLIDGVGTSLTLSDSSASFGGNISLSTLANAPIILPDAGLTTSGNIAITAGTLSDSDTSLLLAANNLTLNLTNNNVDLDFQTAIASLDLSTLGTGNISLTDVDDITLNSYSGLKDFTLVAGNNLTINGAINTEGMNGNTLWFDAGNLMTVNADILDTTGAVDNITDLHFSAVGDINFGDFIMDAGAGKILLTTGGTVRLARMQSSNSALDALVITAGNQIRDNTTMQTDSGTEIYAPNGGAILQAVNGIHNGGWLLEATVAQLSVTNTGGGAVGIRNSQALNLYQVNVVGDAVFRQPISGSLTFSDTTPFVSGLLYFYLNNRNLIIPDTGIITSGDLKIDANNIFDSDNSVILSANNAEITLNNLANPTLINSAFNSLALQNNGINTLTLNEADDISLNALTGTNNIVLTTPGTVSLPDTAVDLTGATLTLNADDIHSLSNRTISVNADTLVINTANSGGDLIINSQINSLDYTNTSAAALTLNNTGNLQITNLTNSGDISLNAATLILPDTGLNTSGNISLNLDSIQDSDNTVILAGNNLSATFTNNTSGINLQTTITSADINSTGVGGITIIETDALVLNALNFSGDFSAQSGANLTLNNAINLTGLTTSLSLNSGNDLFINNTISDATGPVDNNSTINLVATNNLTLVDGNTINAGTGTITINAGNTATISGLITNNASLNGISITASNIVDAGNSQTDITNTGGGTLNATTITPLNIDLASLDLITTSSATLHQQNANALDIQNISVGGNFLVDGVGTSLSLSDASANFGGDISLNTLANAPIFIPDTGLSTSGNITLNAGTIQDSNNTVILAGNNLSATFTNNTSGINLQTALTSADINSTGVGGIAITETDDLTLNTLAFGNNFSAITGGNLTLTDTAPSFGGDINLTALANNIITLADTGLSSSGNISLSASAIQDSDFTLDLAATTATINLTNNINTLQLNSTLSNLQLNIQGAGTTRINNSGNLNLQALNNTQTTAITATGDLIIPIGGLNSSGYLLSLIASDIYTASTRNLNFTGDDLILNITNAAADTQLNTTLARLDIQYAGGNSLAINANSGLTLEDLNADNFAATIINSNLLATASSGDLILNGNLIATDTLADNSRRALVELAALNGDLWLGTSQSINLQSTNTLDQSAASTLATNINGTPNQTSIYLHLGDNANQARSIHMGSTTTAVTINAQGGDIYLDPLGTGNNVSNNLSSLALGTSVQLNAYNQNSDANDGALIINDTSAASTDITNPALNISAKTSRAIYIRPITLNAPPVVTPTIEPPSDDTLHAAARADSDTIEEDLQPSEHYAPVANASKSFDLVFGSCIDTHKKDSARCRLDSALKAFLSKWTVGGELPPKVGFTTSQKPTP